MPLPRAAHFPGEETRQTQACRADAEAGVVRVCLCLGAQAVMCWLTLLRWRAGSGMPDGQRMAMAVLSSPGQMQKAPSKSFSGTGYSRSLHFLF